ncbi:hypothetical protein CCMA1212_004382, partial [Trichoderma ghanense]
ATAASATAHLRRWHLLIELLCRSGTASGPRGRKRQRTLGSTPFASPSGPANESAVPAPSPPLESFRTCLMPPASGGSALSSAITGPAGPLFMLWRR